MFSLVKNDQRLIIATGENITDVKEQFIEIDCCSYIKHSFSLAGIKRPSVNYRIER